MKSRNEIGAKTKLAGKLAHLSMKLAFIYVEMTGCVRKDGHEKLATIQYEFPSSNGGPPMGEEPIMKICPVWRFPSGYWDRNVSSRWAAEINRPSQPTRGTFMKLRNKIGSRTKQAGKLAYLSNKLAFMTGCYDIWEDIMGGNYEVIAIIILCVVISIIPKLLKSLRLKTPRQ